MLAELEGVGMEVVRLLALELNEVEKPLSSASRDSSRLGGVGTSTGTLCAVMTQWTSLVLCVQKSVLVNFQISICLSQRSYQMSEFSYFRCPQPPRGGGLPGRLRPFKERGPCQRLGLTIQTLDFSINIIFNIL